MHQHCCNISAKYRPITHVIFDLDGTIIDSEHVYAEAIRQAVESFGAAYEEDFILKVTGRIQQDSSKITVEHFQLPCTTDEYTKRFNDNANQFLDDLDLMPGAERLITHLHKSDVPMCIATSSGQTSFETKTKKYPDLMAMFHHVVCGGTDTEVADGKPAPDIFLVAASRFAEPPPDAAACLVFEDSVNGLRAGLAAGMQVVLLPDANVAYDDWKSATMRLDSFNYFVPEAFGLPAFPDKEMSEELAGTRVIKYGDSGFVLPVTESSVIEAELPKQDTSISIADTIIDPTTDSVVDPVIAPIVDPVEDPVVDPVEDPVVDPVEDPVVDPVVAVESDLGLPAAESSRNDLNETSDDDEKFITAQELL